MSKTKLAVIGSSSMVGSRFCEVISDFGLIKADFAGKIAIDISSKHSVESFFKNYQFEWVILFSAFTDVDAAEKQRNDKDGSCWQINVVGTKNVTEACLAYRRKLIFTSTDFVFDGTAGPYREDDPQGPDFKKVSWYGITKIEAEKLIQKTLPEYLIIRISYPYRGKFGAKDDIVKRILTLYSRNRLYPMFTDQWFTPTFADDLAPAVKFLLDKKLTGVFHLASPKITSQYEFAKEVISVFGGDPQHLKKASIVPFLKMKGVTPRPQKGGLVVDKIAKIGFLPCDWQNGIREVFKQIKGELP